MSPFLVLGLPRCRTAWLARFLSVQGRACVHEPSRFWASLVDLQAALARDDFAASDSCLTLRWREIIAARPDARLVVVRRSVDAVLASADRLGLVGPSTESGLRALDAACDEMLEIPQASHVLADALGDMRLAAAVFEKCHGYRMPREQWLAWGGKVVVADTDQHLADAAANAAGFRALFPELSREAA